LLNLDKFSEIELDMRDVQNVGQGFADEIFRVFVRAHPEIEIRPVNASGAVNAMLLYASGLRGRLRFAATFKCECRERQYNTLISSIETAIGCTIGSTENAGICWA